MSKYFDTILMGIGNGQTTATGGVLGVLLYLHEVGARVPATVDEWLSLGIAAALAWLGIRAKDARREI